MVELLDSPPSRGMTVFNLKEKAISLEIQSSGLLISSRIDERISRSLKQALDDLFKYNY